MTVCAGGAAVILARSAAVATEDWADAAFMEAAARVAASGERCSPLRACEASVRAVAVAEPVAESAEPGEMASTAAEG